MNARFFLAGADDVEAGPDEAGLLDDSPPPLPLLQLLLPLPCRCSVAEVEGGATLIEGPRQGDVDIDVATEVNRGRARGVGVLQDCMQPSRVTCEREGGKTTDYI